MYLGQRYLFKVGAMNVDVVKKTIDIISRRVDARKTNMYMSHELGVDIAAPRFR